MKQPFVLISCGNNKYIFIREVGTNSEVQRLIGTRGVFVYKFSGGIFFLFE